MYRKPTTKNTTINFLSNHPIEQQMQAFSFHITRMHSLPLDPDKKRKTIQTIAKTITFPNAYSKILSDKYSTKPVTHKPKRKTKQSGPHSLTAVKK
jgi:hypothetical protein